MTSANESGFEKRLDELLSVLQSAVESQIDVNDANYGVPPEHIDIPTPYLPGKFVAPTGRQRYIRADIAAGDANEPLAEYQFRWVMIDGEWEPVQVHIPKIKGRPTVLFLRIGDDGSISRDMESVDAVGPVIRSPEDA